jgi:exopolysaccharide production protein ExoY
MLIQLPGGSPDQPGPRNGESGSAFEAGLRRDLASAPIVSYDATLGGWPKRLIDLFVALLTMPVWMPVMMLAAAWAKVRNPAPVFLASERIGYGGRSFKCFALRVALPAAKVERLRVEGEPENDPANHWSVITNQAEDRRAKVRRVLERLPQMLNVVFGDMALVGPSPLTREQLEPLKTARRYYLSARPGVIGVHSAAETHENDPAQYKIYAMSWAFDTDALILWDALRSLRDRGELWRPSLKLAKSAHGDVVVVRRRNSPNS